MPLLQQLPDSPGYARILFQGPQGSGKSHTSAHVAATLHQHFGYTKPVAMLDTEGGSDFTRSKIAELTGVEPLRVKTRAFDDLLSVAQECAAGASDILIVDSITHVSKELELAFLSATNRGRSASNQLQKLEVGDRMALLDRWEAWAAVFTNAPFHIIVCGREADAWGNEENEETGRRDLVKVGTKLKALGAFGYEARLVIEMQSVTDAEYKVRRRGSKTRAVRNVATVLKDCFDQINGRRIQQPTGADFLPHLQMLTPDLHRAIDVSIKSDKSLDVRGEDTWAREKRLREILNEEINAELMIHFGSSSEQKIAKSDLLLLTFGTRSTTAIEGMQSDKLREGLNSIRLECAARAAEAKERADKASEETVPSEKRKGKAA